MAQDLVRATVQGTEAATFTEQEFVTMYIENQLFGIPVLEVQDIVIPEKITAVPLAPPEIAGLINLRGRIVTVVDLRKRLGLPPLDSDKPRMSVTIERGNELYTLLIDRIGDVVYLSNQNLERNPPTLNPMWQRFSSGVFRLDKQLMVVLDVAAVLNIAGIH